MIPVAEISPYPGLRSFARNESTVFFGRDRCIDGMSTTLQETSFLAVLGPSGGGKSSLVRSGLFEHLEAGLARKAGSRWTFLDIKHPRTQPYRELAKTTLLEERRQAGDASVAEPTALAVEARRIELRRDPLSIVRWWREHRPHPNENLLLLVDQFEELFGYGTAAERDEVETFIDLLLRTIANAELPIYVVMTMRSEFLGGCSLFPGLAEQINRSLSLTPRMTREECAVAIRGPAMMRKGLKLEPLLVTALLNDMNALAELDDSKAADMQPEEAAKDAASAELRQSDLIARRADQLPLMQHVLNWMWTRAVEQAGAIPGPEDEPLVLTLDSYRALGGLRGALSAHANEIMGNDPKDVALTQRIFRALTNQPTVATGGSAESSAVRRLRTIAQLAEETDAREDEVCAIVEKFRREGVSMLAPDSSERLHSNTEIDISHESIIRQWDNLRIWIREEAKAGRSWQQLVEDAGTGKQLQGLDLSVRLRWWDEMNPERGWVRRYGDQRTNQGDYDAVRKMLDDSKAAARRRKMTLYAGSAAAVVLALASAISIPVSQSAASAAEQARAEAIAQAKVAQDRMQRADAQSQAAQTETKAAQASTKAAQEKQVQAEQKVAAANAKLAQAKVLTARAMTASMVAQRDAARLELTAQSLRQGNSAFIANALTKLRSQDPVEAKRTIGSIEQGLVSIEELSPVDHAYLSARLGEETGQLAFYSVDTLAMQQSAEQVSSAGAKIFDPIERKNASAQAFLLSGRASALKGDQDAALAAFLKAGDALIGQDESDSPLPAAISAELAGTYLDLGRKEEARGVAKTCIDQTAKTGRFEKGPTDFSTLTLSSSASGSIFSTAEKIEDPDLINARLTAARCYSVLGSLDLARNPAGYAWNSAETLITNSGTMNTTDSWIAMLDALGRYYDWSKIAESGSPYFDRASGILLNDIMRSVSYGQPDVTPPRWPLESWKRASVATLSMEQMISLQQKKPSENLQYQMSSSTFDGTEKYLEHASISLPATAPSTAWDSLSEAFFRNGRNMIDLLSLPQADPSQKQYLVSKGTESFAAHADFLRRRTDTDTAGLWLRLREQAAFFIVASTNSMEFWEYENSGERQELAQLESKLCGDAPQSPGCDKIVAALANVEPRREQLIAELSAKAKASAPAGSALTGDSWVAFDGLDPAACLDSARMSGDTSANTSLPATANSDPQRFVMNICYRRLGRYKFYAARNGRVWLFNTPEYAANFSLKPERYMPAFGGSDFFALLEGTPSIKPVTGSYPQAFVINGQIYLTGTLLYDKTITPEMLRTANENWQKLRPSSSTQSPRR